MSEQLSDTQRAWLYFKRSLRLRCPVCGISPIFMATRRTEGVVDWFTHLPGCPRCGFAYDREPGYFLFALMMVTFVIAAFGGFVVVILLGRYDVSTPVLLACTLIPLIVVNVVLVRHIKAFYLAIDHFVHPFHENDPDEVQGGWGEFR